MLPFWRKHEDPKGCIQGILPDMLGSNGALKGKRKVALQMPDMRDDDGWEKK
jgi:hypothetical protein